MSRLYVVKSVKQCCMYLMFGFMILVIIKLIICFYTFILKKVMLVRRSTVDLRSWRRALLLAGKLFCRQTHAQTESSVHHFFG